MTGALIHVKHWRCCAGLQHEHRSVPLEQATAGSRCDAMSRKNSPPFTPNSVNLLWYLATLPPLALSVLAALVGWLPAFVLPIALFLLLFWIFSFGFAVYAKLKGLRNRAQ